MKKTIALLLCLMMTLSIFGVATAEGEVSSRDTAVIVTAYDPGRLRSDTMNNLASMTYNRLVYDYLFTRNTTGSYDPCLCVDYTMDEDNMGTTLKLRENVKFHDGNVMTAEDVLFSLIAGKNDTSSGSQLAFIDFDASKVVDDNTLYLKFNKLNGVWQSAFIAIGIIEKAAYEAAPSVDEFYLDPMTTAAYVLTDWVSGSSMTFKAFPEHWYGAPKIENIVVNIITEDSVGLMELQTGGADLLFNLSMENYNMACMFPDVTGYDKQPSTVNVFLGCNLMNEALAKPEVRKALAYAVDWEKICIGAFDGAAEPCNSPLGKNAFGYDPIWETDYPYAYNPEKAKELLKEAGYENGLALRVLVDETPARVLMAEQLYNMLAEVGITLTIDKHDMATTNDIVSNQKDQYDLYIRGAYNNTGDIVTFLATSMGFTAINVSADPENGPRYTDYLERISSEMDMETRAGIYKDFQKDFLENMMYWQPGAQMKIFAAFNSALKGVEMPGEYWIWNNAYFE
ncbi:MAG: ABC transporter substrate-binding protein [Clostridia bacterium]|nr:ABC transporter substrate-binding protein [Clostridia bacterium]